MKYDRLVAEWITNGRRLRPDTDITVVEVINAYRKYAQRYYRKNGEVTREYGCIREAAAAESGRGRRSRQLRGPVDPAILAQNPPVEIVPPTKLSRSVLFGVIGHLSLVTLDSPQLANLLERIRLDLRSA